MTDPESAGTVEPTGTPNPEPSQEPGQQPSGSPDVDALVKAILAHPDYQKDKQSVKDKRIAEIQTNLEAQGSDLARLAAVLGKTPEEVRDAQTKLALEDMASDYLKSRNTATQVPSQPPQGNGVDLASARTSILTQTGLPATAPGFDDYLASLDWNNPVEATLKATAWAAEAKANIKQPSASTIAPAPSNAAVTSLSGAEKEELGKRLIELQRSPTKNKAAIAEIVTELERREK